MRIGHSLRKDEDSLARMEWNPFDGLGRAPGGQCQTWRRAFERETKMLGKSWRVLKLIARNRIRWQGAGMVDALCPREDYEQEEEK